MTSVRITIICLLAGGAVFAWNYPAHARITRAALLSLPAEMRQFWGDETDALIRRYSLYPDEYRVTSGERKAALRQYCEVNGRPIHNVTWNRAEDIESLEYLAGNLVQRIRARDVRGAAQYAGTLAHFLEDSTCPAHALTPPDSPLDIMRDLLPPPPGKESIRLHAVIERSTPEFDLGARPPIMAGANIHDTAVSLLDRTYASIKSNRADLIEVVRATYRYDEPALDKFRHKASVAGAELLADAYYTAFVLAGYGNEHADMRGPRNSAGMRAASSSQRARVSLTTAMPLRCWFRSALISHSNGSY